MPVQMQLSRIIMSEISDEQYIFLKEVDGNRTFPIVIGAFEAQSIYRAVRNVSLPRPMTHDLIINIFHELQVEPQDILINELRNHTYFARLRVRHNGSLVEIDARPSDAIGVAVRYNPPLPIYVAEEVLAEALGG
ncbi:MAG TPA: bifunctional nuclease family protein [Thermogutta sp.]|nr:bifunctional nuclease family protein [Thermogutta sp.]